MSVYHNVQRPAPPLPLRLRSRAGQPVQETGPIQPAEPAGSSPMSQDQSRGQSPKVRSRLAAILRTTSGNFLEPFDFFLRRADFKGVLRCRKRIQRVDADLYDLLARRPDAAGGRRRARRLSRQDRAAEGIDRDLAIMATGTLAIAFSLPTPRSASPRRSASCSAACLTLLIDATTNRATPGLWLMFASHCSVMATAAFYRGNATRTQEQPAG